MDMFAVMSWPVAGFTLYGFGLAVALGGLMAFWLLNKRQKQFAVRPGTSSWIMLAGLILGVILARAVYAAVRYEQLFFDPMDGQPLGIAPLFAVQNGGLSFFGALLGFLLAIYLTARLTRQRFARLFDWAALPIAAWMVFARLAEHLGGEGYGADMTSTGLHFFPLTVQNGYGEYNLSVFVLEALAALIMACLLYRREKKPRMEGSLGLSLLAMTGASQLFLESLRRDAYLRLEANGFIRVSQLLALFVLIGAAIALTRRAIKLHQPRRLIIIDWIMLILTSAAVIAAEFYEKLPLPEWLLYGLSAAFCLALIVVFERHNQLLIPAKKHK